MSGAGRTLARLLERDPALAEDPRRLEGLLRDLHPHAQREVSALVEALGQGLVGELLAAEGEDAVGICAQRLVEAGLDRRDALGAADAWWEALRGRPAPQPLPPPEPRPRPEPPHTVVTERPGTLGEVFSAALEGAR